MKVTGISFIKNAIKFDFPIKEAILSIMPLCDAFIVAIGDSEDDTRNLIASIDSNIQILDTVWDDSIIENAVSADTNWCIYIQGDEVMHEQDFKVMRNAMETYASDDNVDGLLFKYNHFYGSYDYIGTSANWYKNEIRIVKNNHEIYSYRDAQGFRKGDNKKLNVKSIDASVYHYGWVKPPEVMFEKVKNDRLVRQGVINSDIPTISTSENKFDYSQIDQLEKFKGTHPAVMQSRIDRSNWKFDYDISTNKISAKERIKRLSRKILGREIGEYRNYRVV